ncbi:Trafficking protein particle complex subunit 20 [Spathaspora sp. JA1]|nr:Trafficking protein particle complex subunit 20 [Spathaspora sp. JA1]
MSSYYLVIIGTRDNPVYELEFSSFKNLGLPTTASTNATPPIPGKARFAPNIQELLPFIANSSLDLIEDAQWSNNQLYLGKIDSFYGVSINAFLTPGNIKFILCYDNGVVKSEENSIKQFLNEINELYVKTLLNPFYTVNDAIISPEFDLKVKQLARKYL